MRKDLFSLMLSFLLFIAFPFLVHGEESKKSIQSFLTTTGQTVESTVSNTAETATGSAEGIVAETAKSVSKTADDTIEFVEKTAESAAATIQSSAASSTPENIGELAGEAGENTLPAVKETVKEVMGVTEKIITEAENTVEAEAEALPEVPVVTPVVKEVTKTVTKVTDTIKETVDQTAETDNEAVEAVDVITEDVAEETTDMVDQVAEVPDQNEEPEESSSTDPSRQPSKPNQPEETGPIIPDKTAEPDISVNNRVKQEDAPEMAKPNEAVKERVISHETAGPEDSDEELSFTKPTSFYEELAENGQKQLADRERAQSGILKNEPREAANDSGSIEPDKANQQQETVPTAVVVPPSTPSNGGAIPNGGYNGDSFGTLSDLELLQASTEQISYYKNSYAVIQWFHTPLGKPPKTSPFLNVM